MAVSYGRFIFVLLAVVVKESVQFPQGVPSSAAPAAALKPAGNTIDITPPASQKVADFNAGVTPAKVDLRLASTPGAAQPIPVTSNAPAPNALVGQTPEQKGVTDPAGALIGVTNINNDVTKIIKKRQACGCETEDPCADPCATTEDPCFDPCATTEDPCFDPCATTEDPCFDPCATTEDPCFDPCATTEDPCFDPCATTEDPCFDPCATTEDPCFDPCATTEDPCFDPCATTEDPCACGGK
jgi:hypothetical protein